MENEDLEHIGKHWCKGKKPILTNDLPAHFSRLLFRRNALGTDILAVNRLRVCMITIMWLKNGWGGGDIEQRSSLTIFIHKQLCKTLRVGWVLLFRSSADTRRLLKLYLLKAFSLHFINKHLLKESKCRVNRAR